MTLLEILQEKEDRLESVPGALASKTITAQKQILKELIEMLESFQRQDGKILITAENLSRIQAVAEQLSRFIFDSSDYADALVKFAAEFNTQATLNKDYIRQLNQDFIDKIIYQENLQLSQSLAVDALARTAVNQAFINPVKETLQIAVTTGASFSDVVMMLTDQVTGDKEKEGLLLSHVKQVAFDAFAFSDRSYLRLVSQDLGYEFYQYFGGKIQDSRCFCVERANQIFHRKEVEYWGDTPSLWDKKPGCAHGGGRILETTSSSIWVYAGGYHCRHQIVPVAPTRVPGKVMERARKAGYVE